MPLAVAAVAFNVASVWGRLTTQRAWRAWLTDHLIDRWLKNGRYYQLNLVQGEHQNPEFRIADDTRIATESPVDFVFGVTTAVLTAVTFISVLWAVGGGISFTWAGRTIDVPGYLVFVAIDLLARHDHGDALHRPPLRRRSRRARTSPRPSSAMPRPGCGRTAKASRFSAASPRSEARSAKRSAA